MELSKNQKISSTPFATVLLGEVLCVKQSKITKHSIKWESAKVVGNVSHLYPEKLDEAIGNLLVNSEHAGTVVRWSAAYALSQIIKIKTSRNKELIPTIESICEREEKNSIKKIYLEALKKSKEIILSEKH